MRPPTNRYNDPASVDSVEKPITTPNEIAGACISILVLSIIMGVIAILLRA